ncbi:MAG TPA: hypothetical protein VGE24_07065 [Emticicia sp.]
MKKLIVILMMLQPVLIKAQTDSVKVSFSEEKVENFQKTTLIDEYEKAFGNNRLIKSALRVAYNPSATIFSANQGQVVDGVHCKYPDNILQFEQKIGVDKSLIASFFMNRKSNDLVWNTNISLEGRWYYQMKKRINEGKQQPNITGVYMSLRGESNSYEYNLTAPVASDKILLPTVMFRATSTYSFNWGWQFGNGLDYSFSVGIKHGDKATIGSEKNWINEKQSFIKGITPFITTNAQIATGIYFPFRRRVANNRCDFLQCNYEVKQLFKVNVNNAFYFDRYNQQTKFDVAYERKIGRSPFSVHSNIITGFSNYTTYKPTGLKADTTFNEQGDITSIMTRPTYSSKLQNLFSYNFEITEQFRYYINMKKHVAEGKSASNLSGTYIAILSSYRTQRGKGYSADLTSVSYLNTTINQLSMGVSFGNQIQTNHNSFLDISLSLLRQKYYTTLADLNSRNNMNTLLELSLKFGFAK